MADQTKGKRKIERMGSGSSKKSNTDPDETLSGDEDFQDAKEEIDSPTEKTKSLRRFQIKHETSQETGSPTPQYHVLENIEETTTIGTNSRCSPPSSGTVSKLAAAFETQKPEKVILDSNRRSTVDSGVKNIYKMDNVSYDLAQSTSANGNEHFTKLITNQQLEQVGCDNHTIVDKELSINNNHLYHIDKIYDTPPGSPIVGCKQGYGQPVSVQLLGPVSVKSKRVKEEGVYDRIVFEQLKLTESFDNSEERAEKRSDTCPLELSTTSSRSATGRRRRRRRQAKKSSTVGDLINMEGTESDPNKSVDDNLIYEEIILASNDEGYNNDDDDDGWGSSEFEEYSEDEVPEVIPHKPLPMKPKPKYEPGAPGIISRIRSFRGKKEEEIEEDVRCFPVDIDPQKHPPPELPPLPDGLSENQKKRRCVIEQIISSEKSYISSLERIIRGYESTVLDLLGGIKSNTRIVFKESREILSHHQMFQIEMANKVQQWDEDEKIGDVFTASFSKSMLVDAYSVYVNNFAVAMEEIKVLQRSRQQFREFLKLKESSSSDRLCIFGLMVKPVQRFPQFIMFLQDLVKYTPREHHDRRALQLALTELENITHKLNERKRHSEQTFQAKQITSQLLRQITKQVPPRHLHDKTRRLIRQNDFEQVVSDSGPIRVKTRRLILMDDTLLCIKVGLKDVNGFLTEKFKLKWVINLSDVDLKDSAITPSMEATIAARSSKYSIWSTQIERPEEDPFHLYSDLSEMLHDCTILGQMRKLMTSLKRSYQGYGLSEALVHEITRDLQSKIQIKDEQMRLVNSCSFILVDKSSVNKMKYVFQTPSPGIKHEWSVDFLMAKLALDKLNNPGWEIGQQSEEKSLTPAYFMRALSVDVPRNFTKVKCAVPVFVPSSSGADLGVQHLWVCSSTTDRGQVSVISIHSPKPCLTESFKATDVEIECMVYVPGQGIGEMNTATSLIEDTVWIATVKPEIVVYTLSPDDSMKRIPIRRISLSHQPSLIVCIEEKVFCGLKNGSVLVYVCSEDGDWNFDYPKIIEFDSTPIRCLLDIDGCLWVACGCYIYTVDINTIKITIKHRLSGESDAPIDQIVRAGVGIWVSFKSQPHITLYHIETLEILQEINIASPITRLIDKLPSTKLSNDNTRYCTVSSLAAGRGMLWIGTSLGFILTLPLPRLRDGVPLVSSRPSVSYHGHNYPVKFIIPVYCSTSMAHLEKRSSVRPSVRHKPKASMKQPNKIAEQANISTEVNQFDSETMQTELTQKKSDSPPRESKHQTMPVRGKKLSFRTELAAKISSRDTTNSNPDLYSQEREIQMLYQTLLDPQNTENDNDGVNANSRDRLTESPVSKDEEINEQQAVKLDDVRSRRILTQEIESKKYKNLTSKSLRKSTNNSVIVVSGGDGYSRWNVPKSTSIKSEEAALLLWIYKF